MSQATRLCPATARGGMSQSHAQDSIWHRKASWEVVLPPPALSTAGAPPAPPTSWGASPCFLLPPSFQVPGSLGHPPPPTPQSSGDMLVTSP